MKFFFDLFPVIIFFIVFKYFQSSPEEALALLQSISGGSFDPIEMKLKEQAPILVATFCMLIASIGQFIWLKLKKKSIDKMLWISIILMLLFGGLTLVFHNERFIQWKPTILYWLLSFILLISNLFWRKNLIEKAMGHLFVLPKKHWSYLNIAWIIFLVGLGLLNLYVAYFYATSIWVNFKLFGTLGLMLCFIIFQSIWMSKVGTPVENSDQEK